MFNVDAIALVGPTASGKTAAALAIAQVWPVEIISIDSALVYRGMDIGTAKPNADELAQVPHHLIDIRDPLNAYSAAEFARDALVCIKDIASRGKVPLLVGGTMLYFKALLEGLNDMPAADPAIRAQIQTEAEVVGWPAMHTQLQAVDPVTAARLAPHDAQRIQRARVAVGLGGGDLGGADAQAPDLGVDPVELLRAAIAAQHDTHAPPAGRQLPRNPLCDRCLARATHREIADDDDGNWQFAGWNAWRNSGPTWVHRSGMEPQHGAPTFTWTCSVTIPSRLKLP